MKLQNILIFLGLGISLGIVGCSSQRETIRLGGSPVEFQLEKSSTPDVYATYKGGTVSTGQILDQNPVHADLKIQENLIRIEYILRKFADDTKAAAGTPLEIFLPEPNKSIAELEKAWGIAINPKSKITFKATAPDKDVIAQWGDQQIKASDVDASSVKLALVRTRAYKENLNRLKGILVRRALLDAAKAENVEIEEYIKKHITADNTPVTEAEFEAFLAASNIKKADVNANQLEAMKNIALEKRKNTLVENYVAKNLLKGQIFVHEFPPTFKIQVPEGWEAIWGSVDAPVSVLFFGDFVCGPCRDALKDVLNEKDKFKGNVKAGFNFLFSRTDRDSRMISEAALCTQAQGKKYFRKFAELYATNPPGVDEAALEQAVSQTGASMEDYKKCFLSREHQALLNQHLDFATRVGVTSLPTVLVDGEPMEGAISADDLHELIQRKVDSKTSFLGSLWRRVKATLSGN
jgi:protein-disulfide isomerase